MDLDSGTLRAFAALAATLHFGRAAETLGITQQALTKRIQRLESDLGVQLVDRSDRRSIRLTAAGQDALPATRDALDAVDRLAHSSGRPAGRIRVDVMGDDLAATGWVRRAARAGTLPLDIVDRAADTTADHLLLTDRADLAFGRAGAVPQPWPAGIHRRLLLLEPLAILAPHDHPWAERDELPLSALAGHTLWFPLAGAPTEWRGYLDEFARFAGLTIDPTGSTFGYRQWAEDVTAGLAPPSVIGEAMTPPDPRMRTVSIIDPTPVFPWSLLWRDGLDESIVAQLVADMGFPPEVTPPRRGTWMPDADARLDDLR